MGVVSSLVGSSKIEGASAVIVDSPYANLGRVFKRKHAYLVTINTIHQSICL